MLNPDNLNNNIINTKKVKFAKDNTYSELYANKKTQIKQNLNPSITILTNSYASNQKEIIDIEREKEKILLLSQVKSKDTFNSENKNKFAVLTNINICIYNSKDDYLLEKENPEKIFKLNEYKFEVEKKLLIIIKKEEKKEGIEYLIVKKYEFPNLETAIKWWATIISSIKDYTLKNNSILVEYDNNSYEIKELIENNNQDSYNPNEIEKSIIKKSIRSIVKEEINNNIDNINENKYLEEDGNHSKTHSIITESNSENNNLCIKEEKNEISINKDNKESDIENEISNEEEKEEIKDKMEEDKNKTSHERHINIINTKPSFRCLLKEEINKVGIGQFNNNNLNNNLTSKISEELNKSNKNIENNSSHILSSVNNKNKNIYSFGKKNDFNSFKQKNSYIQNKIEINNKQQNLSLYSNNTNLNNSKINKSNISNNEEEKEKENEDDFSESNDIKIKDLSQNNISGNDMFNDKSFNNDNYSKNTNICGKDNNIKNSITDKSSYSLIKLISCEKESKIKSDSIFDISDSNQKISNYSKNEKDIKSPEEIKESINKDIQKNIIRSSFLNNNEKGCISNENKMIDNNNDFHDTIGYFSKFINLSNNNKNSILNNNQNEYKIKNVIKSNLYNDKNNSNILIESNNKNSGEENENDIFRDNISNNKLNKNDEFNDINEIKMFDKLPQSNENNINNISQNNSLLNNSLFNSPKINNFTLENNSSDKKKIFLFSNESNINAIKNDNDNECSYDFSNDIYTDIYENKTINKENEVSRIPKINKNDKNKENYYSNQNNSGSSIVIIDKNNPLLIKSSHYINNNNNSNKNEKYIQKVESFVINNGKKTRKFKNIIIDNQGNFKLFSNKKSIVIVNQDKIIQKKNNKFINNYKNAFIINHFEFQYCSDDFKKHENNNFVNIKYKMSFQIQKLINFNLKPLNYDNNLYIYETGQDSLFENLKNCDNLKKNENNNKNYKKKYKNKSFDEKNNYCFNNYINACKDKKTYKNIYQNKLKQLKTNILMKSPNNDKKKHSRNYSLNIDNEPSYKIELSIFDEELSDDNHYINNCNENKNINNLKKKNNNNKIFSSYYLNKEKKCNKITPKRLNKYINKKSPDTNNKNINTTSNKYKQKIEDEVNNDILNKNINNNKKIILSNDGIYSNRQNYTFTEKSFNFEENNTNIKSEKISYNKYLENALNNRYSIKSLIYCYNQGISTKEFFFKFQENLENIFKDNENKENILEYLFENIPKLIRNALTEKDFKFFFEKNNCNTLLNNYKDENNNYIEDDYCYAKEYIKKLIVNDNKHIIYILNKYYDDITGKINENKLYNKKNKFIQEMKNLNADIVLS